MPSHTTPPTTTTTQQTTTSTHKTSAGSQTGKGKGGDLTPPPGDPTQGVTVAGVYLSATAVDATFAMLDKAMGADWTKQAHAAAKSGGTAIMPLIAPKLPVYAQRSPIVHDVLDKYAR